MVQDGENPQVINVITIDPSVPGIRFRAVLAKDRVMDDSPAKGRETVGAIAKRLDAAVVVNADFFPYTGDPLNLHIEDGELISEPMKGRPVFGITSDGRFLFDKLDFDACIVLSDGRDFPVRGINRPLGMHELVVYSSKYSDSTRTNDNCSEAVVSVEGLPVRAGKEMKGRVVEVRSGLGNASIPQDGLVLSGKGTGAAFIDEYLKPGVEFTINFNLIPESSAGWGDVVQAVGGGPWLARNGEFFCDREEEGFDPGFSRSLHPRTAAGRLKDGKLLLVSVDGRQSISGGMTLVQLADFMLAEGCVEAINLDGGGSTTLATPLGLLNSPSEGDQRPVCNALAIFGKRAEEEIPEFIISAPTEPLESGSEFIFALSDAASGEPLNPELASRVIWGASGGIGLVDQEGRLHAFKARKGSVTASLGSRSVTAEVEVVPGEPVRISARLDPDPYGSPNRGLLTARIYDKNKNYIGSGALKVAVTGGIPDANTISIGDEGKAETWITWDDSGSKKAQVKLTSGNLPAVVVDRK